MSHKEELEMAGMGKSAAKENLAAAESLLDEARGDYSRAAAKYEEILAKAKAEATPELITEAYKEYAALMIERGQKAFEVGDYDEAGEIAGSLKELEKSYGQAESQASEGVPQELIDGLDEMFSSRSPQEKEILQKRALFLLRTHDIASVLLRMRSEIKNPIRKPTMPPPWTGWHKSRSPGQSN